MPISHAHKCIFVHIPKCAGTSIENALGMHGAVKDVGVVPRRDDEVDTEHLWGANTQHFTAPEIRDRVGRETFDAYLKFTFVRNPWDRLVSFLSWKSDGKGMRWAQGGTLDPTEMRTILRTLVRARVKRKTVQLHLREQWRFTCDAAGTSLVDFVGKFESLEADWARVCARMGLDLPLERRMTSTHEQYRSYYTPATRALVHALYRRDVRMFGYRF